MSCRFSWWPWQKQIGWKELDEDFIRFTLLKTPLFRIYLHRLNAPKRHPQCHDHPWSFIALILKGGYWEYTYEYEYGDNWRKPGSLLFRPASWQHNVVTKGVNWSLVITGPKWRQWGFTEDCRNGP